MTQFIHIYIYRNAKQKILPMIIYYKDRLFALNSTKIAASNKMLNMTAHPI